MLSRRRESRKCWTAGRTQMVLRDPSGGPYEECYELV